MKKKILALASLLTAGVLTSGLAQADLTVRAGVSTWSTPISGYVQGSSDQPRLNASGSLGLKDDNQQQLFLEFDHFVPMVPNLRISKTDLEFNGSRNESFTFRDRTFTGNTTSLLDLSHTDITAYYRFLDGITAFVPWIGLRVEAGVTVRLFDGAISVTGDVAGQPDKQEQAVDLDAPLPMGYLAGRITLGDSLSVGAGVNAISYQGSGLADRVIDARYEIGFLPFIFPGIMVGHRSFNLEMDDLSGAYGDLDISGPFAGVYVRAGF